MEWLDKIIELKKSKHITYAEISKKTGIPLTTVQKIFSGRTRDPKLITISKIVSALDSRVDELLPTVDSSPKLTDYEISTILSIRKLDEKGKRRVKSTIECETARIEAEKNATSTRFSRIYFDFPVSAGTGEFMDNRTAVIAELTDEPPYNTSYILKIAGNSMEPDFSDGDYVYVQDTNTIGYGEIGIFAAEGSVYMKKYTPYGLESLNPAYKLIKFYDGIRCLGKVLGKVTGGIEVMR